MTYVQPLIPFFAAWSLFGLLRLKYTGKAGAVWLGVLGLTLVSWPPADWLLSRPLEAPYPVRPFRAGPDIQAIVVLSSGIAPAHYERPYPLPDRETYIRCRHAAWIWSQRPDIPILTSGGKMGSRMTAISQAAVMKDLLESFGVAPDRIWTEERSRSTYENALYSAEILRRHGAFRIALVVDARSMLRAAACFRKQGIAVTSAPSTFREFGALTEELLPGWEAVASNELTLHESVGFAWYWLRNRI